METILEVNTTLEMPCLFYYVKSNITIPYHNMPLKYEWPLIDKPSSNIPQSNNFSCMSLTPKIMSIGHCLILVNRVTNLCWRYEDDKPYV